MRILYHALVEFDLPNGHAIHTREVCEGLVAAGHEVTLLAPPTSDPPAGVQFEAIPFFGFTTARLLLYRWMGARSARRILRQERPDVVIDKATPLLGPLADLARRLGLPLRVELNGTLDHLSDPFQKQTAAGARRAGNHPDLACLAVSPALGELWSDLFGRRGIPTEIFENGANPALFPADGERARREGLGLPEDAFVVGFAGSDNPAYDFETTLDGLALARSRGLDAWFLTVGPSSLGQRLESLARERGLGGYVVTRPSVPYESVAPILRTLDTGVVLLRPTAAHMAPTAMKLKELLLVGTPVVCDLPDCWNGWGLTSTVWGLPRSSAQQFALALGKIADNPKAARERARRGGEIVRQKYTWSESARSYSRILERLGERALGPRADESPSDLAVVPE